MKISQFTTSEAADVMCELVPAISNIMSDSELMNVLREKIVINSENGSTVADMVAMGAKKIAALAPILLKAHKNDVFDILAALNKSTREEIAEQNVMVTMRQIKEAAQDEDLLSFFGSLQQEGKTK